MKKIITLFTFLWSSITSFFLKNETDVSSINIVNFNGNRSLIEADAKKKFSFQIKNVSGDNKKIALFGGLQSSKNPLLVQAGGNKIGIPESSENDNIIVSNVSGDYDLLVAYLRENPSLIVSAQLTSTTEEQIGSAFEVGYQNPYVSQTKTTPINLSSFRNQNTFNPKMVLAVLNIVTAKELELYLTIMANTTLTVELHIGEEDSRSKALRMDVNSEMNSFQERKSRARLLGA